jgi:uncharacterized membrane protein
VGGSARQGKPPSGKLWLCVMPAGLFLFDVALTLIGQPSAYWAGDYALAHEASPPGRWLLAHHPAAFIGAAIVWTTLLSLAIAYLPKTLSKIVALSFVIGHAWGASSWFWGVLKLGYWADLLFFALAAAGVVLTWERFERLEHRKHTPPVTDRAPRA